MESISRSFHFILVIYTTALSEQSSILFFHDVTCHNLEASPSYSCPYSYYQKVQEYHNCYQHHVKEWHNQFVTDDAAGWDNRKTGFMSWHTDSVAGWKNMRIGFVSQHKFQNLLYSFHASSWLQYLSHDHRAPPAPAVLVTNLTDYTPLH